MSRTGISETEYNKWSNDWLTHVSDLLGLIDETDRAVHKLETNHGQGDSNEFNQAIRNSLMTILSNVKEELRQIHERHRSIPAMKESFHSVIIKFNELDARYESSTGKPNVFHEVINLCTDVMRKMGDFNSAVGGIENNIPKLIEIMNDMCNDLGNPDWKGTPDKYHLVVRTLRQLCHDILDALPNLEEEADKCLKLAKAAVNT